jgi:hypothetical protein
VCERADLDGQAELLPVTVRAEVQTSGHISLGRSVRVDAAKEKASGGQYGAVVVGERKQVAAFKVGAAVTKIVGDQCTAVVGADDHNCPFPAQLVSRSEV